MTRSGFHSTKGSEEWIESQTVDVTISNLNPETTLNGKKNEFKARINDDAVEAMDNYSPGAEDRAYAHVKDDLHALSDSINP